MRTQKGRGYIARADFEFTREMVCIENIKLEVSTSWQTQEHPLDQMTVADELEHILFFITDVLYRVLPPLYEDLQNSILRVYGEAAKEINISNILAERLINEKRNLTKINRIFFFDILYGVSIFTILAH